MWTALAILIIGVFFIGIIIKNVGSGIKAYKEKRREKKQWNEGICPYCEKGNWVFYPITNFNFPSVKYPPDFFSPIAKTTYYCERCGKKIEMSYIPFPKNTKKFDIVKLRRDKLNKIKNVDF